ncbi:ABC transporter permease subunit [Neobacillus novalis]|uniref:ABC transporter permease subunit n=1 Tax=Neobacillus novalis TaxID=220687 RepID=A0AA95MQ47_9BACI|nr:ABC transporter permease subunit [Neobacillus novalis]WHY84648.1 ABC transporter permease subunit [Neobacillus novalis]
MNKVNWSKIILFIIFSVFLLFLSASFIVEFGMKNSVEPERLIYTSEGKVLRPPFPSSIEHPLGTDKNGNDFLFKLINGFKYTFFISAIVTLLRLMIGIVCSFAILFYLKKIKPYIETFLTPFLYVPAFILFILLAKEEEIIINAHGEYFLIFYQIIIVSLIGFPPLLFLLIKEYEQLLNKDYVVASRLLGANKFHLVRKQIFPVFKRRLFIVFIQQTIATIILLIHLGVFQIFIGGKVKGGIIGEDNKYLSNSSEWGGMIGQSILDMVHFPWLLIYPALAVIGLILLLNIMIMQLEKIYDR